MDALIAEGPNLRTELTACERERFGFDHAIAGRMLATTWKLPQTIVTVIGGHHACAASVAGFDAEIQRTIGLLGLVDELVHFQLYSGRADTAGNALVSRTETSTIKGLCGALALKVSDVQNAIGPAFDRIARQSRLLGIEVGGPPSPAGKI
jgi:hypothetical protein